MIMIMVVLVLVIMVMVMVMIKIMIMIMIIKLSLGRSWFLGESYRSEGKLNLIIKLKLHYNQNKREELGYQGLH